MDYLEATWPGKLGNVASLAEWLTGARSAYPATALLSEARKARAWELANPSHAKKNARAFLGRWWARCQDRGGSSPESLGQEQGAATAKPEPLPYSRRRCPEIAGGELSDEEWAACSPACQAESYKHWQEQAVQRVENIRRGKEEWDAKQAAKAAAAKAAGEAA